MSPYYLIFFLLIQNNPRLMEYEITVTEIPQNEITNILSEVSNFMHGKMYLSQFILRLYPIAKGSISEENILLSHDPSIELAFSSTCDYEKKDKYGLILNELEKLFQLKIRSELFLRKCIRITTIDIDRIQIGKRNSKEQSVERHKEHFRYKNQKISDIVDHLKTYANICIDVDFTSVTLSTDSTFNVNVETFLMDIPKALLKDIRALSRYLNDYGIINSLEEKEVRGFFIKN